MRDLYIALKAQIEEQIPAIKKVGLFNNQFKHLLRDKPNENPFQFPAVFIEMNPFNFCENTFGLQNYDLNLTTHLGFKSHETDDLDILTIKQDLYQVVQRFRQGYFDKLIRKDEEPDFDHGSIQVYRTIYKTHGKDYSKVAQANATLTGLTLSLSAQTN